MIPVRTINIQKFNQFAVHLHAHNKHHTHLNEILAKLLFLGQWNIKIHQIIDATRFRFAANALCCCQLFANEIFFNQIEAQP